MGADDKQTFIPGWYYNPDFHATWMWWDGNGWVHERTQPWIEQKTVSIGEIAVGVMAGSFLTVIVAYALIALLGGSL